MVERRVGADAHEFLRSDLDDGNAGIVVEVRNDVVGHKLFTLGGNRDSAQSTRCGKKLLPRTIVAGADDS
jgi:hypothetical protein